MERWWGPGWDGSLILSTNARPIPSITLERNYTDPFKTKWLSWIGPWRASIAMGEAESDDVPVPNVRFFAARVNFKPRPWLEFGLTRTAQWCGGDRRCDWDTFTDMLLGQRQPGRKTAAPRRSAWQPDGGLRHAAAFAVASACRWRSTRNGSARTRRAVCRASSSGSSASRPGVRRALGGWRLRAEYADTACNFSRETPEFDCAYRNAIYPQGYAYRGRIIGHSMDNDSRMYTLAGLLTRHNGDVLSLTLRRIELNRDGGPHAISEVPLDLDNVELRYSRGFGAGKVSVGVGVRRPGHQAGFHPPACMVSRLGNKDSDAQEFCWFWRRCWRWLVPCRLSPRSRPPEQLELLRTMSPEDREALMEQLGLGGAADQRFESRHRQRPRAFRPRTHRPRNEALSRAERLALRARSRPKRPSSPKTRSSSTSTSRRTNRRASNSPARACRRSRFRPSRRRSSIAVEKDAARGR